MAQTAARLLGVFLIGLVGWLGASVLRVEGLWLFVMAVVLGAIAGVVGTRPILLPAVARDAGRVSRSSGSRRDRLLSENWTL